MSACTEHCTPVQMAATLSAIFHHPVETSHVSKEAFYSPAHRSKIGEVAWSHYKAMYEG
mgnify:CR=1 FL=1|jgi:hypothetical protein